MEKSSVSKKVEREFRRSVARLRSVIASVSPLQGDNWTMAREFFSPWYFLCNLHRMLENEGAKSEVAVTFMREMRRLRREIGAKLDAIADHITFTSL